MKIRILSIVFGAGLLFAQEGFASGDYKGHHDPQLKRFAGKSVMKQDPAYQQALRQQPAWQKFVSEHGQWNVIYNEHSGMPHRAIGTPVTAGGYDARSTAENFLVNHLGGFRIPMNDLQFRSVSVGEKYRYVNYFQKYNGLEVLFSHVQVKMTHDYRVMQFALDCYPSINISTQPLLSENIAIAKATTGVTGVKSVLASQNLKVLPIPSFRKTEFKLVYEILVANLDAEGIPGKYYTLVDANNGEILYRSNKVHHITANTDVNVTGTLHLTHPYDPATVEPLKNMKIVENGNINYTDGTGYLGLTNTSNTTATFSLEGRWVKVQVNNSTPSWTVNLAPGTNNIDIDNNTNIRQRTTYNAINTVYEQMKLFYPSFTGLDYPLPANVDVAGSCNAFYDGNSVNFFAAGGGCNATSLIADVCYHEYGHGINDKFYQSIGFNFDNGAMGEGYADIWGLSITNSPILGIGFFDNDPNGFVRRYDIDKKVYPQDLVGEVHADGEIIAGCFWDTYLNLGNMQQMMNLFTQSYYAGISGPDGTEGQLYQDVLVEVLTIDDNDGNLANGTPNYCAITAGFAIHGIILGAATSLTHTELLQANPLTPIIVQTSATGIGAGSLVNGFYRIGSSGTWTPFSLTNTTGTTYEGTIPAQPAGTIVEYYLGIQDNCGTLLGVVPGGANDPSNPNIPYYVMVGFDQLVYEDFDTFFGNWQTGIPSDDAITGNWIIDTPVPSFVGNAMVQPDIQFTPGGSYCALTGNASSPAAGAGENDVDGGKTTLLSPEYDLSSYNNPAFSFYRWYSNDQGATPGTDFWQVDITGDGVNYVPVENTNVADHSWRRFAFRVLDYITPTANVSLRFIAEDANAGSLIEALVDDLILWNESPTGIPQNPDLLSVKAYPNPATDRLQIQIGTGQSTEARMELTDAVGKTVLLRTMEMPAGNHLVPVDVSDLAAGLYQFRLDAGTQNRVLKISILR
jgi:hypothetical protein